MISLRVDLDKMLISDPWGEVCYICAEIPEDKDKTYGLLGPLTGIKTQHKICEKCYRNIQKYSKMCRK